MDKIIKVIIIVLLLILLYQLFKKKEHMYPPSFYDVQLYKDMDTVKDSNGNTLLDKKLAEHALTGGNIA